MGAPVNIDIGQAILGMEGQRLFERFGRLVPITGDEMFPAFLEMVHHFHQIRKRFVGVEIQNLENLDRFGLALDDHLVDIADPVSGFQLGVGVFADQQLGRILLAGAFQPRRQIDAVADHRVIHALGRADIARYDIVRIQTDTSSSAWPTGTPKAAMMASPMNLSSMPPSSEMQSTMMVK